MRRLLVTRGSPLGRAVRIVLDELGLDYALSEDTSLPSAARRAQASATLQAPTLWDRGLTLWESGVIAEYLLATYPDRATSWPPLAVGLYRPPQEWQDKRCFATIQTLGSSVTLIAQLTWAGLGQAELVFLQRSKERLAYILSWLDSQLTSEDQGFLPDVLSLQDIFLATHLRFVEARPLGLDLQLALYPKVAALVARLDQRQSFQANPVRWWQPGVVGYQDDGTPIFASDVAAANPVRPTSKP